MHILICDDDLILAQSLAQHVKRFCDANTLDVQLSLCTSAQECLNALAHTPTPDLFFLDIYLHEKSGFDLAHQIRQTCPQSEIAFVTAYAQHMSDAFAFKPLGYVVKPFVYPQVEEVLKRFLHYSFTENRFFSIDQRDHTTLIAYDQIAFFESSRHVIVCHQMDGKEFPFSERLDALSRQLPADEFLRCHKSYVVRLRAIQTLDRVNHLFTLVNGMTVPISRHFYRDCVDAFLRQTIF